MVNTKTAEPYKIELRRDVTERGFYMGDTLTLVQKLLVVYAEQVA